MSTKERGGKGNGRARLQEHKGRRGQEREEGVKQPFYSVRSLGWSIPGHCWVIEGWGIPGCC